MPDGWIVAIDQAFDTLYAYAGFDLSDAVSSTSETMTPGTWQHVAAEYNAVESTWYFAIDGVWCTYDTQAAGNATYNVDAAYNLLMGALSCPPLQSFLEGRLQWLRISDGLRWAPGVDFTPPDMCSPPAIDVDTDERWAMDEGGGLDVAAGVLAANDGTGVDITWGLCT